MYYHTTVGKVLVTRLSVVLVNWNTRGLLRQCLQSVYSSAGQDADMEVLVVDNGSSDGSAEMVRSDFPRATLMQSAENLGFARANNLGIRESSGDYLLLLNSDTEVVGDAIPRLLAFADRNPGVGMVGPMLLNPDGTVQSSRRRFPTVATAFLESTILERWFPQSPTLQRFYVLDRGDDETQQVDWLVGAALLARREAVAQAGPLDEGYFMYSEELDWGRAFARAGWKVVYLPEAKVVHFGGQSSDQDLLRRHLRFQYSKGRYFQKHHGPLPAQLIRVAILLNYLAQLAEESAKFVLVRRNHPVRRRRIGTLARASAWMAWWAARWGHLQP